MGNSKDTSYSYVGKSNYQLLNEKFQENVNEVSTDNRNTKNTEGKKKKKKSFLSKWLSSVRGSWSSNEERQPASEYKIANVKSLEENVDVFEIPLDPEMTFTKTIETESKNFVAQNKDLLSYVDELYPNEKASSRDDTSMIEENEKKIKERSLETSCLSEVKKNSFQKIEPLLTSALFIHKDIDRMVESAVFMEPNLPKDYAESSLSNGISQKSLRNSNAVYDGKENEKIIKTLKTTSEPTWEERKKIIHQERMKENVNFLVKQYVYLDAVEVRDFTKFNSNSTQGKKSTRYNYNTSDYNSRDLSREVSPEILVNIKPFKEYLSENIMITQRAKKSSMFADTQDYGSEKGPTRPTKNMRKENKVAAKPTCPVLKSTLTFLKKDSEQKEKNSFRIPEISTVHFDRFLSEVQDEVSDPQPFKKDKFNDLVIESSSLSFWETYSPCKNMLPLKVEVKNSSYSIMKKKAEEKMQAFREAEEEVLQNCKSLDKVLEALEDKDHDLIFQKNLHQFKKKISVLPRFDFKKTVFPNKRALAKIEDKVWEKLIKLESPLSSEINLINNIAKVADFSLEQSRQKKIEMYRSKCLDLRMENSWKSKKVLENLYFLFYESSVINQVFATRIEAKTFSFCQTFREVYDMMENNMVAIIKIENPINFDETSKMINLFNKSPATFNTSHVISPNEGVSIALCLYLNQPGSFKNFVSNEIIQTDESDFENFQLLPDTDEQFLEFNETQQDCLLNWNDLHNTSHRIFFDIEEETEIEENEENEENMNEVSVRKRSLHNLIQEKTDKKTPEVILILNDPSYEYTARIYDQNFASRKILYRSYSEPDLFKHLDYEKSYSLNSAMSNPSNPKKTTCSGIQGLASWNMQTSNYCNDGFLALYSNSKQNFDDDKRQTTLSCQSFIERQSVSFNIRDNKEEVKIQKSMEQVVEGREIYEKLNRIFKYKNNLSPKKTITHNLFFLRKPHMSRSQISLKEAEKEFMDILSCRKKNLSSEEMEDAFLSLEAQRLRKEESFVSEKFGFENNMAELKPLILKAEDKKKMFLLNKNGTNVEKEVMAAIKLIKDMNFCKGDAKSKSKQISFIIFLSRNSTSIKR